MTTNNPNQSNQRFAGLPQFNAPMVDNSGRVSQAWQWFFTALWQKNGSTFSEVPNAAYSKQQPGLPITMHDAQTGDQLGQMLTGLQIVLPPDEFTVTQTTDVDGNPEFTVTWNPQGANLAFMGPPGAGPTAVPIFRLLVPADLPIATTSDVGVVKPDGTTITIDPDGTIHSVSSGSGSSVFLPDCPLVSADNWPANFVIATPLQIPAGRTVVGAGMFGRAASVGANWSVAIYSGDIGGLVTLEASSAVQTGFLANVLNYAPFSSPFTVPADGLYWVAVFVDTTVQIWGSARRQSFWSNPGGVWPATAPAQTQNTSGAGITAFIQ